MLRSREPKPSTAPSSIRPLRHQVYAWARSWAMRHLYRLHIDGGLMPDLEALTALVMDAVDAEVRLHGGLLYQAPGEPAPSAALRRRRLTWDQAERMAEQVAAATLVEFSADEANLIHARAVAGGKASKRGRTLKAGLAGVETMSIAKAAQSLGVSKSTIQRMRRDAAKAAVEPQEAVQVQEVVQAPIEAEQPAEAVSEPVQLDSFDILRESVRQANELAAIDELADLLPELLGVGA